MDGSLTFDRPWLDYQTGFGDVQGEYWLGLNTLHNLTTTNTYSLYVEMISGGECSFAAFDEIHVGPEADSYRLSVSGYQAHSTAGDSVTRFQSYGLINNRQFSTISIGPQSDCSSMYLAGWWYAPATGCYDACATCLYNPPDPFTMGGIQWYSAYSDWRSFDYAEWSLVPVV